MYKKSTRQGIFFIIILCLFFLMSKLGEYWENHSEINRNLATVVISVCFTLIFIGIYYLARLNNSSENFWDVSDFAKCRGGSYMWQGDSEEAKMCQNLASTEEGRCGIASYNCPTGFNGIPALPFEYTPLSSDDWKNERCNDNPKCPCTSVGMTSFVKEVE